MPSSTSSSDTRGPEQPWGRTWVATAAVCCLALGTLEVAWRIGGHAPTIHDSADLWTARRREIGQGPRELVVLGASRAQLGIDLATLAEAGARHPTQLAINGASPMPVLEALAGDESFTGTVLCAVTYFTYSASDTPEQLARDWVRREQTRPLWWELELPMRLGIDASLSIRAPDLRPHQLPRLVLRTQLRQQLYLRTLPDRSRLADYGRFDPDELTHQRQLLAASVMEERRRDGPAVGGLARRVRHAATAIRRRGGEVVLLRLPSTGLVRDAERRRFPRTRFWNPLVQGASLRAVHFEDHPELQAFPCPDGSHLDRNHRVPFTRALLAVLEKASPAPGLR